jgi:hypothetical protein
MTCNSAALLLRSAAYEMTDAAILTRSGIDSLTRGRKIVPCTKPASR